MAMHRKMQASWKIFVGEKKNGSMDCEMLEVDLKFRISIMSIISIISIVSIYN